jgi:hypothetical protein
MEIEKLLNIVKILSDTKPDVLNHLRVWAGEEDDFPYSEAHRESAMQLAEGFGLITVQKVPKLTKAGLVAIELSECIINSD